MSSVFPRLRHPRPPGGGAEPTQRHHISMQNRCKLTQPSTQVQAQHMIELSEQQIIEHLATRLAASHQHIEPAHVKRVVHEEYARFEGRPIRDFTPLLVERNAKVALSTLNAEDRPLQGT